MLRRESGRFDLERGKCEALVESPEWTFSIVSGVRTRGGVWNQICRSCHGVWRCPMGVEQLGEGYGRLRAELLGIGFQWKK